MAVGFFRSYFPLVLLGLAACAGDLVAGVPRDGGETPDTTDTDGDGGTTGARGDGGASNQKDAAVTPPGKDGGGNTTNPNDAGTQPTTGSDAGTQPTAGSDAGTQPTGGRDLSTDKSKFAGSPRCPKDVLFCDDFEAPAVGAGPSASWSNSPFNFAAKIDSTHVMRGSKALLFATTAGSPGVIQPKVTFPVANNSLYGRMFLWIEGLPTSPEYAHWVTAYVQGSSSDANKSQVRLDGQLIAGKNAFGIGSDGGDTSDWHTPGTDAQSNATEKTWICLEWLFKGDTNETRVWVDGNEQTSLHLNATNYRRGSEGGKQFIHPTYANVYLGWWQYVSGSPANTNVWIDEVVIDKARIGCVL